MSDSIGNENKIPKQGLNKKPNLSAIFNLYKLESNKTIFQTGSHDPILEANSC